MKTLFVLRLHSFVDVITNSSSELFVLDTDKSIEAVKSVLGTLIPAEEFNDIRDCVREVKNLEEAKRIYADYMARTYERDHEGNPIFKESDEEILKLIKPGDIVIESYLGSWGHLSELLERTFNAKYYQGDTL